MNWIDTRVRKPKEKASLKGKVWVLFEDGFSGDYEWQIVAKCLVSAIAWLDPKTLPKFTPIADPPEGYRWKQGGDERTDKALSWNEWDSSWVPVSPYFCDWQDNTIYAVPIDPPKPKYRPFANAGEFEPFKDRWWRYKSDEVGLQRPPCSFCESGYGSFTWSHVFDVYEFAGGMPFGIPV